MARSSPRARAALILVAPVLIAVMMTLFAWPSARLAPRGLPLGLVGTPRGLPSGGDAFSIHRYPDEAAARHAIEQRHVYGAVLDSPGGRTVLVASAASLAVAQLLERTFAPPDASARVVDVVAADPQDPRGAALASSVLPFVMVGIIAGAALGFGLRSGLRLLGALVATAVLAGLVADGIVQGWLGVLGGSWAANAGVLALTLFAIAAPTAGLAAVVGAPGIGLAAVLMMVIGNPFSAITSAPELLPSPVGTIGQLLPPGAGGNLLRSTAFFDGAGGWSHFAVLAVWAALGLTLALLAGVRTRRSREPAAVPPRPGRDGGRDARAREGGGVLPV